jgi:hypothetical protein
VTQEDKAAVFAMVQQQRPWPESIGAARVTASDVADARRA